MKRILILTICTIALGACSNATPNQSQKQSSDTTAPTQAKPQVKVLKQGELDSFIQKDSVILIDVRTPGEVADGYIPGADSFIDINNAAFEGKIGQLNTNYTYVMYCRSGGRSGRAASYMINNGFTKVYNLEGGMLSYKGVVAKP